jgi:hypothetical protein
MLLPTGFAEQVAIGSGANAQITAWKSCTSPSPKCWLWLAKEQPQDLWIRMRRKDGTRGWSKRAEENFTEGPAKAHPCP